MILDRISLKVKIYFTTGLLLAAMTISISYSLTAMNSIGKELVSIAEKDLPILKQLQAITVHQLERAIYLERALYKKAKQEEHSKETNKIQSLTKSITSEIDNGSALIEKAKQSILNQAERKEFEHLGNKLNEVKQLHDNFTTGTNTILTSVNLPTQSVLDNLRKIEHALDTELEELTREIIAFTENAALEAEHHELDAINMLLIISAVTIVCVIIALTITILGLSRLSKGISSALKRMEDLAQGNLVGKETTEAQDEVGALLTAIGSTRVNLHSIIKELAMSATSLVSTSEKLAHISSKSSEDSLKQQHEIDQVATAMTEMTAAVGEVASNAVETFEAANQATKQAQTGQAVSQETVTAITSLSEQIKGSSEVIQQVGDDSTNINTVLDVIKNIAEQTNLLALNAAIEAARAGEQGRGFAVVADEVRTLAKRTQESTSEIEEMISRLQASSKDAIENMKQGNQQVIDSVSLASEAGSSLNEISNSIDHINNMNAQISSAAEEQTAVAEEVNRNFLTISDIAKHNTQAVVEVAREGEELAALAAGIKNITSKFKV